MKQTTLFETFDAARGIKLRDDGIRRSVDNAESALPGWKERALSFVKSYPGNEFKTEDIRAFAYANGLPKPPNERAWGAVIVAAKNMGIVAFARFEAVDNPKAHRTPASVWIKT